MNYTKLTAAAILASGAILAGCGDAEDETKVEFTLDNANQKYDQLEVRFDDLKEDIEARGDDVSEEMQRTLDELELRLASIGDELHDAADYTQNGWIEVQDEMAENLDDLERSVDRAWNDIRS
ncbi:MAG: hypothetical protein R3E97_06220 [Candidatus Eisenbacteria bacterium]